MAVIFNPDIANGEINSQKPKMAFTQLIQADRSGSVTLTSETIRRIIPVV